MNVFIYDSFLNQKKYDRLLAQIETRITDLGLNGKICRLSLMKNVHEAVAEELKRGAKTIVAVGNNKTVNQVLNSLVGSSVPLGIIPIGQENNDIAAALGIDTIENACNILSARLLARLDLGLANQTYFLGHASIENQGTLIDMGKSYTIETAEKGTISIFNLASQELALPAKIKIRPDDNELELIISAGGEKKFFSAKLDQSVFKIKKVFINNPKNQLILDGSTPITTPAEITVVKQCLNIIVGKSRNF